MKILPATTELPATPIERRHAPRTGRYPTYRQCLRWDFGFTCAFCFLHEADFVAHGVEGTGLTSIEHHLLRSHDEGLANEYANCLYACRYCNRARGIAGNIDDAGRRLLDPCATAWHERFELSDFALAPRDPDAAYTCEAYDLNDARKTAMRRDRFALIEAALNVVTLYPGRIANLLAAAATAPASDRQVLVDAAHDLQKHVGAARRDLIRFAIVPADAAPTCRCETAVHRNLPAFLARQGIDL